MRKGCGESKRVDRGREKWEIAGGRGREREGRGREGRWRGEGERLKEKAERRKEKISKYAAEYAWS